jgi:adenine-specific DNA-methyltransferase
MLSVVAPESAARRRQGELGQFFTPPPVADFMASLFGPLPITVRLLDAGAGAGALTAALVSHLCEKKAAFARSMRPFTSLTR